MLLHAIAFPNQNTKQKTSHQPSLYDLRHHAGSQAGDGGVARLPVVCCPGTNILHWAVLCAGGMLAAKQEIKAYPTRTNQIPRHVPPPHWASHPTVLFLAAGLLPFGTIFVELYFAMTSIWQARTRSCSDTLNFFWCLLKKVCKFHRRLPCSCWLRGCWPPASCCGPLYAMMSIWQARTCDRLCTPSR